MSSDSFEMEKIFTALADKTRLRLLNLMRRDEVCVYFFTEILGESQPKISRHLAVLRRANLVSLRRDGKWIHYRLREPGNLYAAKVLRGALEWMSAQTEMREDLKNFARIRPASKSDVLPEANTSHARPELEIFLL